MAVKGTLNLLTILILVIYIYDNNNNNALEYSLLTSFCIFLFISLCLRIVPRQAPRGFDKHRFETVRVKGKAHGFNSWESPG